MSECVGPWGGAIEVDIQAIKEDSGCAKSERFRVRRHAAYNTFRGSRPFARPLSIFSPPVNRLPQVLIGLLASTLASNAFAAVEPALRESDRLTWRVTDPGRPAPTFSAAQEISGVTNASIRLRGEAVLRRPGTVLAADQIDHDQVTDQVHAEGQVRLFRDGDRFSGQSLRLSMADRTGVFTETEFVFSGGAAGQAQRIEFLGERRVRLIDARYTGSEGNQDWYLRASEVELDYENSQGVGRNAVLVFKGVPLLASPVLAFPIGDARRSGLLPPTVGFTTRGGFEYLQPYYLNLAPNYDLTLNPRLITRRGLQLGAEFRYLQPDWRGDLTVERLDDRDYGSGRDFLAWRHHQLLAGRVGLSIDYSQASDDDYFRDFSPPLAGMASTTTLTQSAQLNWSWGQTQAMLRVLRYQTLQDRAALIAPPYERVPQLNLLWQGFDRNGFDLRVEGDFSAFDVSRWPMELGARPATGNRIVFNPSASYTWASSWYQVTPRLSWHSAWYDTRFSGLAGRQQESRHVPIFSLDGQLFFERPAEYLGRAAIQTLEPRLYYLNVPYRNQRGLPNYESSLADFNLAQIFSDNLFTGFDRIADANQLTAALTSRWLDADSGSEIARVTVGQRTYFDAVRVAADEGAGLITEGRSDLLMSIYGVLTPRWEAEATLQYNLASDRLARSAISTRYRGAGPARVVNLSYRLQRNAQGRISQESFEVSGQWPIAQRWYGVGRFDYSALERRPIEILAGLEYDGGTWVVRGVAQRYSVARNERTSALFLQLELNGFARLGSSPMDTLQRGIRGYEVINPPQPAASVFERYPQ